MFYLTPTFPGHTTDESDIPVGFPNWKSAQALKALLDRVRHKYEYDDTVLCSDEFIEISGSELNNSSMEDAPLVNPQPVMRKQHPAKATKVDMSDDEDGKPSLLVLLFCDSYMYPCLEAFNIILDVTNQCKGSCSMEIISSAITWTFLQECLAKAFDIYPLSLQAQYQLSMDAKALLLNLQNENDLEVLITLVHPLIVPSCNTNGSCSNCKMKPITVQAFNKGDETTSKVCHNFILSSLMPPHTWLEDR